jgi:hypothetical protein
MWITLKHLLFKRNGVEAPFFNIPNILMNTENLITHLFYVFYFTIKQALLFFKGKIIFA